MSEIDIMLPVRMLLVSSLLLVSTVTNAYGENTPWWWGTYNQTNTTCETFYYSEAGIGLWYSGQWKHKTSTGESPTSYTKTVQGVLNYLEFLRIVNDVQEIMFEGWVISPNTYIHLRDQQDAVNINSLSSVLPLINATVGGEGCNSISPETCDFGEISVEIHSCGAVSAVTAEFPARGTNFSGGSFQFYSDEECTIELFARDVMEGNGCDRLEVLDWVVPYISGEPRLGHVSMHCEHGQARLCGTEAASVRLINSSGNEHYSGRLELFKNGQWGTVCSVGFNNNSAQAVCRSLGLAGGEYLGSSFSQDAANKPIHFTASVCTGNETTNFMNCSLFNQEGSSCTHSNDVYVACSPGEIVSDTQVCQEQLDNRECDAVAQVGNCLRVGENLYAKYDCGTDTGYFQHSLYGLNQVDFSFGCDKAAESLSTTVTFREGETCVSANDPNDHQSFVKISPCTSGPEEIVIEGYNCSSNCSSCQYDRTWSYNITGGPCTIHSQDEVFWESLSDGVQCPNTISPTQSPTLSPTVSPTVTPTMVPTDGLCTACVNGTSGPCRSQNGTCFSQSESAVANFDCTSSSESDIFPQFDTFDQYCLEHVERCTPQSNKEFQANNEIQNISMSILSMCRSPRYLGSGAYTVVLTPDQGEMVLAYSHVEDNLPRFYKNLTLNQSSISPYADATESCKSYCCEQSQWCLNAMVEIYSDVIGCHLLSDEPTLVDAGIFYSDFEAGCDSDRCIVPNISLGQSVSAGDWLFANAIASINDNPRRFRVRKSDVLNTLEVASPPGYTASNVSFMTVDEHCDIPNLFYGFKSGHVARHFFRFDAHPNLPVSLSPTKSPSRQPTVSPPSSTSIASTTSTLAPTTSVPTSSPTISLSTYLDNSVNDLSQRLNAFNFSNSSVQDVLDDAASAVEDALLNVIVELTNRMITQEQLEDSEETLDAVSSAWGQIQRICENVTIEAARLLPEGEIVVGQSRGGSISLTSVNAPSDEPLLWPYSLGPTNSSISCTDISQRNNESSPCYFDDDIQDSFFVPSANALGLSGDSVIVSFISYNATAFADVTGGTDNVLVGSKVLSVTIDGVSHNTDFKNNESVIFNLTVTKDQALSQNPCVFWNEDISKWNSNGCTLSDVSEFPSEMVVTCICTHLTSFAILLDAGDGAISDAEAETLSYFVYVCVAISIGCLSFVIVIYLMFASLRSQAKKILLHLCITYDAALILFLIAGEGGLTGDACTGVAAGLHFALFATFLWMLAEGHHLYQTFVNVFKAYKTDDWRQLKFYMAFAYLIPLIEVVVAVVLWPEAYERDDEVCFLSRDNGAIWLLAGPVLVVILLNIIALIMISRVIISISGSHKPRGSSTSETIYKAKRGFKSTLMFGSIMGITWSIGYLSLFFSDEIIFHYVFATFNALGGVWIFAFHLLMDPEVNRRVRRSTTSTSSKRVHKKGGVIRRANRSGHDSSTGYSSSNNFSTSEQSRKSDMSPEFMLIAETRLPMEGGAVAGHFEPPVPILGDDKEDHIFRNTDHSNSFERRDPTHYFPNH